MLMSLVAMQSVCALGVTRSAVRSVRRLRQQTVSLRAGSSTTDLSFGGGGGSSAGASTRVYVGRSEALRQEEVAFGGEVWESLVESCSPGDEGACASAAFASDAAGDGGLRTVVAACLPEPCSRHNSPLRGLSLIHI